MVEIFANEDLYYNSIISYHCILFGAKKFAKKQPHKHLDMYFSLLYDTQGYAVNVRTKAEGMKMTNETTCNCLACEDNGLVAGTDTFCACPAGVEMERDYMAQLELGEDY